MKILALSAFCFFVNLPLGFWRKKNKKFSVAWFIAIHAAVPFIIAVRLLSGVSNFFIPLFIALAVLGQLAGGRWGKIDMDFMKIMFGKSVRRKQCKSHFGEDDIIIDNFRLNPLHIIPENISDNSKIDFYLDTGKDIYLLRLQNNNENKIFFTNQYNKKITLLTYIVVRKTFKANINEELSIIIKKLKSIDFPKYYDEKIFDINDWK
jgi:hypothetical protein